MELHVPALEALGYAEKLGFIGDGEDNGMGADFGPARLSGCVNHHRARDAEGKIGSQDDVVELGFCW